MSYDNVHVIHVEEMADAGGGVKDELVYVEGDRGGERLMPAMGDLVHQYLVGREGLWFLRYFVLFADS